MAGQNFGFFSVQILICPKFLVARNYFLPKFFENRIFIFIFFFFFFAVTQIKIYIEDQFLRKNMWEKRTQHCWNDVLVLYLINRNYVVSFVINDMIAITVIFYLFLLSYGFDIFFVILNLNAFWKIWSVIFCNDFFQTFHVFFFVSCFELDRQ